MKKLSSILLGLIALTSCTDKDDIIIPSGGADLVVVGNIYTSDAENNWAEAFAVKDGRYIYVGSAKDAMRFVNEGRTQVLKPESGMIMAGCTEGHGHYITEAMFKQLCYLHSDSYEDCLKEIQNYYNAHKGQLTQLFGYGWFEANMEEHLTEFRQALDAITTEIPVFICDREMHQGWVNSKAMEMAGLKDDATKAMVDRESIPGGTVYRDQNGVLLGRVQDQACGYLRKQVFNALLDGAGYVASGKQAQEVLLAYGYTNYMDAWLSYDNTDGAYKAFQQMDIDGALHMNVVGCYEIDSYKVQSSDDYQKLIAEAKNWQSMYTSTHFQPNTIKLFADGCTESFQGLVLNPYPATGDHGTCNWEASMFDEIVEYINRQGLLVHTHCYGDSAVQYVVDAYVASYNAGHQMRNSLGHAASVTDKDMERLAQYGFGVAENFCWHSNDDFDIDEICNDLGTDFYNEMYPMKRFFDYKVPVCSSTDAPCSVGYPSDPFGIMEMMLTGVNPLMPANPRNPSDCTTLPQAIDAMTINGAWNLGLEDERGSITKGKYADFIVIDRDLFKSPVEELHNTRVLETYFEGQRVYGGM